jgi:hypothetical protein
LCGVLVSVRSLSELLHCRSCIANDLDVRFWNIPECSLGARLPECSVGASLLECSRRARAELVGAPACQRTSSLLQTLLHRYAATLRQPMASHAPALACAPCVSLTAPSRPPFFFFFLCCCRSSACSSLHLHVTSARLDRVSRIEGPSQGSRAVPVPAHRVP